MRRDTQRWLNQQNLNDQQKAAVVYTGGPMRILAGAGTGKTQTLTTRFAYLVREHGVRADQILALTFSRKAAEEMRNRVQSLLEGGHRELAISTFHSFCLRLMTEWRKEEGLPRPRVIDEQQRKIFSRKAVHSLRPDQLRFYAPGAGLDRLTQDLLTLSDRAKEKLLGVEEVESFAASHDDGSGRLTDLALAFRAYQDRLTHDGWFDFGDLARIVIQRLDADPALLAETRARFPYLLVDEFQDTNEAQFTLIELLAENGERLCVVGDPNQSIYAFRGARADYIRDFETTFPGAKTFKLEVNHRSGSTILAAANALIRHNREAEQVELRTVQLSLGVQIHLIEAATADHEAEWIARRIRDRMREPGNTLKFDSFAILVRSLKTTREPLQRALAANGIPYRLGRSDAGLYEVAHDVIAAIRLASGSVHWDDAARLAVRRGNPPHELRSVERKRTANERNGYLTTGEIDPAGLTQAEIAALGRCRDVVMEAALHRGKSLPQLTWEAMLLSGRLHDSGSQESGHYLRKTLDQASALAESGGSVDDLIEQLTEAEEDGGDEAPDEGGGVHLLTVHAAKGLEWDVVFVAGLANGFFPLPMRLDRDFDLTGLGDDDDQELTEAERREHFLKEERRLAYVAITRGKEAVYLSAPRTIDGANLTPSPFLREALPDQAAELAELDPDGPPATIVELARSLRRQRQRALAKPIDDPEAADLLATLMLVQYAADGVVDGASPIRDRLVPEPYDGRASLTFSYTALKTYETCPRQYLYDSVFRLREDSESVHSTFGTAVHLALSHFNQGWMEHGHLPDQQEIRAYIDTIWPESGFELPEQRRQLKLRAIAMLARYYDYERGHVPQRRPRSVEGTFWGDYGVHRFTGKIDLVVADETGNTEIIDFKTGSASGIGKAPESLQLFLYDLAWRDHNPGVHPTASFYRLKHKEDKGFVLGERWEKDQIVGIQHTDDSAAPLRDRIDAALAGVVNNDFTPTPSDGACGQCRFRWLCPEG